MLTAQDGRDSEHSECDGGPSGQEDPRAGWESALQLPRLHIPRGVVGQAYCSGCSVGMWALTLEFGRVQLGGLGGHTARHICYVG